MKVLLKHISILVIIIFGSSLCIAQADSLSTDSALAPSEAKESIEPVIENQPKQDFFLEFSKYKSDQNPDEVYFNVLKITNNTNESIRGILKITIPDGWSKVLQNDKDAFMNIAPGETEYVPVRIGLPKKITGGLAYVISAEFVDQEDILLTPSAYCYINIPRVSDWRLKAENRYFYVSETETFKKIGFRFENRGNAKENLKLNIELGRKLEVVGTNVRQIETGITLNAYSDTTIEYLIKYNTDLLEIPSIRDNRIVVTAKGDDDKSAKSVSFWFEQIKSTYNNELVDEESPLIVWLNVFNLLSEDGQVTLQGGVKGNIFFDQYKKINYNFFNANILNTNTNRTATENYYNFSRFWVYYHDKYYGVGVGDVNVGNLMLPLSGRGVTGYYRRGRHNLSATATRNIFNPVFNFGGSYSNTISGNFVAQGGLGIRQDNLRNYTSIVPTIGGSYRFMKQSAQGLFSLSSINLNGTNLIGYGHRLNYNNAYFKNLTINLSNRYTTSNFLDLGGNFNASNGGVVYTINQSQSATLTYSSVLSAPSVVDVNSNVLNLGRRDFHLLNTIYSKSFKNGFTFNAGPGYQYYYYENSINFFPEYISHNYQALLGASKRNMKKRENTTSGNVIVSYTDLNSFDENGNLLNTDPYLSTSLLVNNRWGRSGLIFGYYYGAPSYTAQRYYFRGGAGNKSIRINPYLNKRFLENRLLVNVNATLWYQVTDKTTRITAFSYLDYDLGKGWSANANILFYNFNRIDLEGGRQSFTDVNFNLGIQKIFDLPQPRGKYYDLKLVFFKDLNGNRIKDENEVGIPDIMVEMENKKDSLNGSADEFFSVNLMTDQFGQVQCIRMPEDVYIVRTRELSGMGEYINELGEEFEVSADEDKTIYIPFIKSNKIYGKIVIKRDPFSSLGYVSPGNIRVTATDTRGNEYSSLTDKDGNFILFAPQAGQYTVRVKNIFGSNFKMRQREFVVDFNGLKEFKVTFLFEENKRKINFKGDINGFNFAEEMGAEEYDPDARRQATEFEEIDYTDERYGGFNSPEELDPLPLRKDMIFFTVQVGAYNLDKSKDIVEDVRSQGDFIESETPLGLTRFTIGEYSSRAEAEVKRRALKAEGNLPNSKFIIVVGEYFGKYLTADEAEALQKQ